MRISKFGGRQFAVGVGAALALCSVAALTRFENGAAFAQAPLSHVPQQQSACRSAVQGRVAVDGRQNMSWSAAQLNALCGGAETSTDPGVCYAHAMTSNSLNYGGGTSWIPANALRLCAGASSAQRRVSCFEGKIAQRVAWSTAIDQCIAEERVSPVAPPVDITRGVTPPVTVTTPAVGNREPTLEEVQRVRAEATNRPATLTCRGPLAIEVTSDAFRPTQGFVIRAQFTAAASAASLQPGQCWRTGGWGNGMLMGDDNAGIIEYQTLQGSSGCPLIASMRTANGVPEMVSNDTGVGQALLDLGTRPGLARGLETTYLGRLDAGRGASGPTRYVPVPIEESMSRVPACRAGAERR